MRKSLVLLSLIFCFLILGVGCTDMNELLSTNKEMTSNFYINDSVNIDDIVYNVYNVEFCDSIPSTLGGEIKSDYTFVYIKIKITNNSRITETLDCSMFTLYAPNLMEYNAIDYIYMYNRMNLYDLPAGFEKDFHLVFEIPNKQEGTYMLERFFWTKDNLLINLKNK